MPLVLLGQYPGHVARSMEQMMRSLCLEKMAKMNEDQHGKKNEGNADFFCSLQMK